MESSLCAILAFIFFFGDNATALPQLTKITNGTLSNVTAASQRTYKSYGQAVIELVHDMKVNMAYFVLSKREQICKDIWNAIAVEKSLQAKFFFVGDPGLKSSIIPVFDKRKKPQLTMITNVQDFQLEDILKLAYDTEFDRWSFIILADRIPALQFQLYSYVLPPIICTQFEYDENQMLQNRNKAITFYDYQHDTMSNQPTLIPFASWKNGVLHRPKMTASKETVGIFNRRSIGIMSLDNPPVTGYGIRNKPEAYATQMFQGLNEYFGNRVVVQSMIANTLAKKAPVNCAALAGLTFYAFTPTTRLSTKIPTMGKLCIGFTFLKSPVYPTADIFINPFPKEIWLMLMFIILMGHIILKFQVWLQMVCRQSPRKVTIHDWLILNVDEDLRLARSLGIPLLSVKITVLLVTISSFIISMIYSTMFASALTNMKDSDIPYHSVAEFYEKWQESSICYTSFTALSPILLQAFTVKSFQRSLEGKFFLKLSLKDSLNLVFDKGGGSITNYVNDLEQKVCFMDFADILQYFFQRRCNYGNARDVTMCMDMAPLAFTSWFAFSELYQNALLRFKENGIARRLRLQFSTTYKDCNQVSFLKPIQLFATQYIFAICFIGCLVAVLVLIVELVFYWKLNCN